MPRVVVTSVPVAASTAVHVAVSSRGAVTGVLKSYVDPPEVHPAKVKRARVGAAGWVRVSPSSMVWAAVVLPPIFGFA